MQKKGFVRSFQSPKSFQLVRKFVQVCEKKFPKILKGSSISDFLKQSFGMKMIFFSLFV